MDKIYYTKPSITELEIRYVQDAIENGWGSKCYDYIKKFQLAFAAYLGEGYALATSSCTGALHLGLAALGIGEGDEVIAPETTWVASISPILYLGAKPVLVDVSPENLCLDPEKIEAAITSKTKAILVVHLYGNVAEMDAIMAIANKHQLPVIEDTAQALGSAYKGKKVGTLGELSTFSFHGTKTMTTGEGGMVFTRNKALYDKIVGLNDHGRVASETKMFFPHYLGYKYKISNLQAALGLAQTERLDELIQRKKWVLSTYKKHLDIKGLQWNHEPDYVDNSCWLPTIVFDKNWDIDLAKLFKLLGEHNIDTRTVFYPVSSLPFMEAKPTNTVAYDICQRAVNLPSYFEMTEEQIMRVAHCIKLALKITN